jgi:predicted nucleic acid-binding protein
MVKVLFDTSTLVAALVVNHPQHESCFPYLQQAKNQEIQGFIATHTLAELYAVLTRLPLKPPISPTIAQHLIDENFKTFQILPLITHDYYKVIEMMVVKNIVGGGIYDALIAQVVFKEDIDQILTLNPNHFIRLGEEIAAKIKTI